MPVKTDYSPNPFKDPLWHENGNYEALILYIKYMVCLRCVIVVKAIMVKLGFPYKNVSIGKIELLSPLSEDDLIILQSELLDCELSLATNRRVILTEEIKNLIRSKLRSGDIPADFRFSDFLSSALHYDYTYLANIFVDTFGITIEKFYIDERIAHVMELISYGELTITEISYQLNFSSVPHLCSQFKKITGFTTAEYKKQLGQLSVQHQSEIK